MSEAVDNIEQLSEWLDRESTPFSEELKFRDADHTYWYKGNLVPGVTTVLKPVSGYGDIPEEILRAASERGKAVHSATELHDLGGLDWSSMHPELFGYMDAYLRFLYEVRPEILDVELRVHHKKFGFAGTMDRRMRIKKNIAVLDLKATWQMQPTTGPQTAAYKEGYNFDCEKSDRIVDRYGLQLKRDGTYELFPYRDISDWQCFMGLLAAFQWKRSNRNDNR